jgi:hypothetical protein
MAESLEVQSLFKRSSLTTSCRRRNPPTPVKIRSLSIGAGIASRAIVALLKIQRTMDRTVVFTVSGQLDAENVSELCQLIDAEPAGAVVVLDFTDVVLADRDAIRSLRDCETGDRIVLHNSPTYIRLWMAGEEDD